jgi:glutamyl-tRNA reductase
VLVCPISFAADCLETLEELHIRAAEGFEEAGGKLHVCPAMNADGRFIDALRQLVLRGPRPVVSWSRTHRPLIEARVPATPTDSGLDALVMIGVSLANRVGPGRGPQLEYSDADGLACAKRSHESVERFLAALQADGQIREAFVWNTCYRCELYAWLKPGDANDMRRCIVGRLQHELFDVDTPGLKVNTLFGPNAWHHLMRTIAGLNSGLPGDKDIVAQFETAFRLAERAGTAGPHAQSLVKESKRLAERMRRETAWGRLDPGYCHAALSQVQEQIPLRLANLRHVVIGGSTTSRSVLHTLYETFGAKERDVTLAYRSHQGGQMKLLRKAVRHGRRLRVGQYDEAAVLEAIADADVVHFGIDRPEAVLTPERVCGLRDLAARPLYVVDFNTAGSTRGLEEVPGVKVWTAAALDREVERFAERMCSEAEFPQIVQEAEQWIESQAPATVAPSLELPCRVRDERGFPSCSRCGRVLETASDEVVQ